MKFFVEKTITFQTQYWVVCTLGQCSEITMDVAIQSVKAVIMSFITWWIGLIFGGAKKEIYGMNWMERNSDILCPDEIL